jgi:hypothetical protein
MTEPLPKSGGVFAFARRVPQKAWEQKQKTERQNKAVKEIHQIDFGFRFDFRLSFSAGFKRKLTNWQ